MLFHRTTDVDDIVGDDPEADPAVHSEVALVAAAAPRISTAGKRASLPNGWARGFETFVNELRFGA